VLASPTEQDRVLANSDGIFDVALLVEKVEDLGGGKARVEADPLERALGKALRSRGSSRERTPSEPFLSGEFPGRRIAATRY
jgi:hypothetical protein